MSAVAPVTPIRKGQSTAGAVWLSPAGVCELIPGLSTRQLQRFRDEGRGPKYSKVGKTIVYREADVLAWLDRNTVTTKEQS